MVYKRIYLLEMDVFINTLVNRWRIGNEYWDVMV
jgi:hypothetical protein